MANPPQLAYKDVSVSGIKVLNEEEGVVEAFVAGIGNKDSVGDIIQPGAFESAIDPNHPEFKLPKGVWSHNWDRPVSKTLEIYEVDAGDSRLPTRMKAAGIGGLYVKTQFNLETQDGRDAFSWVKFYDDEAEWSIGYQTLEEETDKKKKANLLNKVKLFEYSPVLFGANPLTATVGVKVNVVSNGEENDVQIKIEGIEDDAKKEAVVAALEAAVADTLDSKEDNSGDELSEKDEVIDGGEAEEGAAEEEKSDEEIEVAEETVEDDASEKGPEGLESEETTEETPDEEKDEDDPVVDEAQVDESEAKDADDESDEIDEIEESDEDVEKTAFSAVVDSFMTYGEKSEFTSAEAKAINEFVSERVETKAVQGSYEQRLGDLNMALMKEFEDGDTFVYLYATFESTVVFYKTDFSTGEAGFYEVSYSADEDGISFGEEKDVEVVEVVMAKNALMEAAFKGHSSEVKSMLSPLVETSEGEPVDGDIKQAIIDGLEAKAGAKLSKSNRSLIEDAVKALEKVLDAAIEEESEKSEEEDTEIKDEESEVEVDTKDAEEDIDGEKPWHIEERDGEYCVIKDSDGSTAGCHKTRSDAESQMAALYASESGKSEEDGEKTVYTDEDFESELAEIQAIAAQYLND